MWPLPTDLKPFYEVGISALLRSQGLSDEMKENGGRIQGWQVLHGDPRSKYPNGQPVPLDQQTYTRSDGTVLRVSLLLPILLQSLLTTRSLQALGSGSGWNLQVVS